MGGLIRPRARRVGTMPSPNLQSWFADNMRVEVCNAVWNSARIRWPVGTTPDVRDWILRSTICGVADDRRWRSAAARHMGQVLALRVQPSAEQAWASDGWPQPQVELLQELSLGALRNNGSAE